MSQPGKKKNAIISYMSKRKRFKKKFRIKECEKVTGYQANSNIDDRREKDWFTDQYEKLIGKRLPRKELSTDEVLRKLQESTKYRWVPEANTYKSLTPQPGNVHYIEWRDPMVKVCKCPDRNCSCTGTRMFPRKKIPRGQPYIKSPWIRKLVKPFRKSAPPPTESFVQRLAAVVGVEAAVYQDLERKGILNIRGAEFCMSRCIRYYGPGNMPTSKYFLDNQKLQSYQTSLLDNEKEDDARVCDSFSCTVSTQSTVGPTGELVIGDFSHVLYSTLGEAIVRDIEGTELQILSYKSVTDSCEHKSYNLCSFSKLLGIRELINIKELKNQFSLLKQNIYTSIFAIKEKISPEKIIPKQSVEDCEKKDDSSEDITIPTPYKGVVLKAKKKAHECLAENQPPQFSLKDNEAVRLMLPEQLKHKTSEINNISMVPNKLNSEKEAIEEPTEQRKIDVTQSKTGADIEIRKQKKSIESSVLFLNSDPINTICDVAPKETNKCLSPLLIKSIGISESTENHADLIEKITEKSKNLKRNNEEVTEASELRLLSNETSVIGTHTERTNIFFKKRVYGISIDQLQNINIKKFIKCFSDNNGVFIRRYKGKQNQKGLQADGSKSIQYIDETKSKNNERQNRSYTKSRLKNSSVEETKTKEQVIGSNLLTNCSIRQIASRRIECKDEEVKSNHNINTLITENQVNCHKLPDLSLSSLREKNIVNSVNTNIVLPSLQQPEIYNIENQTNKSKECTLTNSRLKISPNSEYNRNKSVILPKDNEVSYQQPVYQNIKESSPRDSNMKIQRIISIKNEVSKRAHLLTKKVSNLSSVLKRILRGKRHKSIKSLPEPTIHRSFHKSYETQDDIGEMERKTYIKNSKIRGEEPETSEREMFSIQYSVISEMKCSSKFLKIDQDQELHGIRGPVPQGIRRLTA